MFKDIIKLIETKEYDSAVEKLKPLLSSANTEIVSKANFYLGYINTCRDYKKKNPRLARRYLYSNLNGSHPLPMAYVLYAEVAEDKNVAINYLNKGIQRFPAEPRLYDKLLRISEEKDPIIERIKEMGFDDPQLLGSVLNHLISIQQWENVVGFITKIRNGNELNDEENTYLQLIEAYSYLFGKVADYQKAQAAFKEVIDWDIDNQFAYSHYLGLIYSCIKSNDIQTAISHFDKLPVGNFVRDFNDIPFPLDIIIDFETVYAIIFGEILELFGKDVARKKKCRAIYSMYLYYPSDVFDIYRYKKSDALALANYLRIEFNSQVAAALFGMRCHFKQFVEAYDVLWEFLKNHKENESMECFGYGIIDDIPDEYVYDISGSVIEHLGTDEFDMKMFIKSIFPDLVKRMHSLELFDGVRSIAQLISTSDILESGCAFECAYAYGKEKMPRAAEIYEGIIKKEESNTSCINNLGVQYEYNGDLYGALACFEKAALLCSTDELYKNNQSRIRKRIQDELESDISKLSNELSINALNDIGYSVDLCKMFYSIDDRGLRDILLRDLRECVIAVVARQDKLAAIMCGSILEAILMYKITKSGIEKYDISEISRKKNSTHYSVVEMSSNELLYVAHKEQLIDTTIYQLGHYVRDYRNIVHPAKEKRMKETISHEDVMVMWSLLKRIVNNLFEIEER